MEAPETQAYPAQHLQSPVDELATWTINTLINRTDVYGRYLPMDWRTPGQSNNYTAPQGSDRVDGALTHELLVRHYQGHDQGDLLGIHAISKGNTSRWFVVDIDQHAGADQAAGATNNCRAAGAWWAALQSLGFHPLLLDSNGAGGFHLLQIFNVPIASELAYKFAKWLVRDYQTHGFTAAPETFPKQPNVNEQRPYGNWWRLPGRHHTRDHWTRVWNGGRWLACNEAAAALLATQGDSPELIPLDARNYVPPAAQRSTTAASSAAGDANQATDDYWLDVLAGHEPGGRHAALLRLAGHLLGKRVNAAVVEELLVDWNALKNNPPKEESTVRRTVRDLVARHEQQRRDWQSLPYGHRPSPRIRLPG
jgi:hypothetical protein